MLDGNACTQTDTCQNGTCTGANPMTCPAPATCHVAGTCNPSTGVCSTPNATNGTTCNDGNACTQSDSCQNGTCTGTNPDFTTDKLNCGTCGHSCLGGDCVASVCQPYLIGQIPSMFDYARQTTVTGGKVYVLTQNGQGSTNNIWQFNPNTTTSNPPEVMTGGSLGCVMNGVVFWFAYGTPTNSIKSCTFSNCAATTQPIVNVGTDYAFPYPNCDPANNEIIWATQDSSGNYIIHRASATGTNQRTITSLGFPNDGTSYSIANSGQFPTPDKLWYASYNGNDAAPRAKLYYISTSTVNAQGILVATYTGQLFLGNFQGVQANGSMVLASGCSGTTCSTPTPTYQTISAPLPNGTTGTPPKWTDGLLFGGTIDGTTFYGTISNTPPGGVPQDAVVKCPLSNCATPTILARGQGNANYFATDSTAIYYTTSGTTATAVWKLAK